MKEGRSLGSKDKHFEMRSMQFIDIDSDSLCSFIFIPFDFSVTFCFGIRPTNMYYITIPNEYTSVLLS